MIVLENATKFYKTEKGKKFILKNVSLKIPSGVNVGILGVNGAGKSTLLRMLGGIDFPNSGRIYSNKTFSWPMGLAGGFQGSMTGRQNVRFVCRVFSKTQKEINKIIDFVKEFSELGEYFDMPIKTYSSGMRSRLTFALSLAFDFDYLLIDETLSVGDARFKQKSKNALLEKIKNSNVLMVSHSMSDLKTICDVGIVLHNGNLTFYEKIDDAILRYKEINLGIDDFSMEDFKKLFYTERSLFFHYVTEAYLYVYENKKILKFIGKANSKKIEIVFELDDEFLKSLNDVIFNLYLQRNKKNVDIGEIERKIIRHFYAFLDRWLRRIYVTIKNPLQKQTVFEKRIPFFTSLVKNNKKFVWRENV
jgi:capsular polysaccharide transport system ATP-binding protein